MSQSQQGMKIICSIGLSTLWVSSWEESSSAEVWDGSNGHICPSKDRVKPAVVSNECRFTGVWICLTSASLARCPLVSQHSCHEKLLSRHVKSCWKHWFQCRCNVNVWCYHAVNGKWFSLLVSGSLYWPLCEFKWMTSKFNSFCLLALIWK